MSRSTDHFRLDDSVHSFNRGFTGSSVGAFQERVIEEGAFQEQVGEEYPLVISVDPFIPYPDTTKIPSDPSLIPDFCVGDFLNTLHEIIGTSNEQGSCRSCFTDGPCSSASQSPGSSHDVSGFSDGNNHHSPQLHQSEGNYINSKLLEEANSGGNNSKTKALQSKPGCFCDNSQCKNCYCACFKKGVACTKACRCKQCHNKIINLNKLKARQKCENRMGCTCTKTGCKMNYCHCYEAGVRCSAYCRCKGCQNMFGARPDEPELEQTLTIGTATSATETAAVTTGTATPDTDTTSVATGSATPDTEATSVATGTASATPDTEATSVATGTATVNLNLVPKRKARWKSENRNRCMCRKTGCRMNYCRCYAVGVRCSVYCWCKGCQNRVGARPGESNLEQTIAIGTATPATETAAVTTGTATSDTETASISTETDEDCLCQEQTIAIGTATPATETAAVTTGTATSDTETASISTETDED